MTDEHLRSFAAYADYVNPNKDLVDADLVQRVHRHGMKILPYTVRDRTAADLLFTAGVDGFITDFPELGYTHHKNKSFTSRARNPCSFFALIISHPFHDQISVL